MRSKFVTELGDVTIIKASEFAKTFNPDQLRDDSGKWTVGGGSNENKWINQGRWGRPEGSEIGPYGTGNGSNAIDLAKVPQEQITTLEKYAAGGYISINSYLRNPASQAAVIEDGARKDLSAAESVAPMEKQIANLDKLIASAPPLLSDRTTYRGIQVGQFADQLKSLQPGDSFIDKGFVSTDREEAAADEFAFSGVKGMGATLQITSPAGSQGLDVQSVTNMTHGGETEWLLPRNSSFTVTDIKPASGRYPTSIRVRLNP